MATDGIKIIDGDLAHDVYWGFMDLYDEGMPMEDIRHQMERGKEAYDFFEYEIFITAYALALWETCQLTEPIKRQVRTAIDRGACAQVWAEQSQEDATARERELNRFWNKISTPKRTIRQRKYRKIINLLFSEGDVLTFQLANGSYAVTIVLTVSQHRESCSYEFAKKTYRDKDKPDLADVINYDIVERKVPSGVDLDWEVFLKEGMWKINDPGGMDALVRNEA
ncbi:hypothetical protein QNI16_00135 [Cytophagaceae bacterium YF14B1]|uniref:Uncharacterized protein n=1 Tax=Xanthocytophaga flava TaxID=3048013 RepID=A0AAE3QHT9_9BACT|nr:hypothetical protein [Xanthocytophaga flavus]MDJ1478866.1 hypothetical protein [Xanthocytophaga flavus]